MPRRVIFRNRGGIVTRTVGVIAIGAAVTTGVIASTWTSPDTSAPSLFLSAPADGATVSGTATVSATCGDNVGCAGVQFKLNGANLNAEDTSAPFSISWDTTVSGSGTYTLTAVARDAAGNTKTSTAETIIVSPAGTPDFVANEFQATTGSDTCTHSSSPLTYANAAGHICLTAQKAYSIAASGDIIGVKAGSYGPSSGRSDTDIWTNNSSLTSAVTFECADGATADSVDYSPTSVGLSIRTANWITYQGACFHFPVVYVNSSGDTGIGSDNIVFDGVHMDSFWLAGAHDTTIKNSTIGPALYCADNNSGTAATKCSNWASLPSDWQAVAHWWAQTVNGGSCCTYPYSGQMEPYIADRGNGADTNTCSHNVTLSNDVIKEIQSTDSATMHAGGLLIDGHQCSSFAHNLTIQTTAFEHSMTYAIEMDGPMSGTTIQNNWIGSGYSAMGTSGALTGGQDSTLTRSLESLCRGGTYTVTDMLIRYNSGDGYFTLNANGDTSGSGCWTNVREIGNVFTDATIGGNTCGGWTNAYTGIVMDYNSVQNRSCGSHASAIASLPFTSILPASFNLDLASSVSTVPQSAGADYTLTTDYHAAARSATTNEGAVGP